MFNTSQGESVSSYTLRSSGPISMGSIFLIQTFGVDERVITYYQALKTISTSDDMMGLGGQFESAKWQQLPYAGGYFSGSTTSRPKWLNKDLIGGVLT
jgi:hypothetical protein